MKLIDLLLISLLITSKSAKIVDDQALNALTESTTVNDSKVKVEAVDAPANTTKPTCFYADIDALCFNKTGSTSGCDCEQHPEDPLALVCCNVTDINKSISCSGSNTSLYQNIHIINARQSTINLSNLNNLKQVDSLSITDGNISNITGAFSRFATIKCLNFSNNNIIEISEHALSNLRPLQFLDLSANNLTKLPMIQGLPKPTQVDIRNNLKIPCTNVSHAIERGVDFLYKEASKCEIPTIYNWFNSTATVFILEYEKKNTLKAECPKGCDCGGDIMLYSQLEGGENNLVLHTTVDCSSLGLTKLPEKLPDNTISLNVSNNSISALSALVDNNSYQTIRSLFADDNIITSIEELDGK